MSEGLAGLKMLGRAGNMQQELLRDMNKSYFCYILCYYYCHKFVVEKKAIST